MRRWAERLYRAGLRVLPARLRAQHGDAMVVLFLRDVMSARMERGRVAAAMTALGGLGDLVRRAWIERRRAQSAHGDGLGFHEGRGGMMAGWGRDLRHAVRSLARAKRFSLAAVTTLALGIGATTAVFTVVDGVILRPLPFPEPDRVLQLAMARAGGFTPSVPYFKVHFWREHASVFDAVTTYAVQPRTLSDESGTGAAVRTLAVDRGFFEVVGRDPRIGRALTDEDQRPGGGAVVLLAHDFWMSRFAGRRDVLGTSLELDGRPHTIVGVMGDEFTFPFESGPLALLVPLARDPDPADEAENFPVIARLSDGVGMTRAESELERVWTAFREAHPGIVNEGDDGLQPISFQMAQLGIRARLLWVMAGAIGILLLIACANVAALLMARTTERRREMAVRSALGASRVAILRHVLAESMVVAAVAGLLGVALASVGVDALLALNPDPLPRAETIGVDVRVVSFAILISALTALMFGLPAALPASRDGIRSASGARTTTSPSHGRRLLVGVEAALSIVLLVGAGLLTATFVGLLRSDPGYDVSDVVALSFPNVMATQPDYASLMDLETRVEEALKGLASVGGSAWVSSLPLERGLNIPVGPTDRADDVVGAVEWRAVTPGYVSALDLEVVRGRDFAEEDRSGGEPLALVNESFAERFFTAGAEGEQISIGRFRGVFIAPTLEAPPSRIIGVVADQRDVSLRSDARPTVFVLRSQVSPALAMPAHLLVEGSENAATLPQLLRSIRAVAPELPEPEVTTLSSVVSASLASERFHATLLVTFAALALLLTALGIAGVVSYEVRRRRREIGIRLALGEGAGRVVRSVTNQGLRPVIAGLLVGLVGALYLARWLSAFLWGVSPTDPVTLASVTALLAGVALVASWLPARAAARANPVEALRAD